ncbi:MAG: nucleotide pyrophosphohydrolase [Thermoprotei archaeon]|nr:nucleotide pyrophosphohydrolase [Thermoprotei archaeon]
MRIKEFQEMMRKIYFERDKKRGLERTYIWLVEEIGELGRAIISGNREDIEGEVADVFAWLASLCNLLDIDLEKASIKKYPGVCPKCRNSPCTCP